MIQGWSQFDGVLFSPRLQNCQIFLTDNLEKVWKDFVSEEKMIQTLDSAQQREGPASSTAATLKKGAGLVATMASRVRRKKGATINKEELVHVSHMTVT